MSVKQRPVRKRKVAGHNRPRPALEQDPQPELAPHIEPRPGAEQDEEPRFEPGPVVVKEVEAEAAGHSSVAEEEPVGEAAEIAEPAPDVVTRRSKLPMVLVAATALLVGAGAFFLVKAQTVDTGMDTEAMTEVNGQVKAGLEKIFSFSYDKVDPNVAHDVLAGQAVGEYDKLIQQVRTLAPEQKLVLATRVTTTGVKSVDGGKAELLVFLDQVATRVDTGKTNGSAAALSVTAEKQNGVWKIVSLIPR